MDNLLYCAHWCCEFNSRLIILWDACWELNAWFLVDIEMLVNGNGEGICKTGVILYDDYGNWLLISSVFIFLDFYQIVSSWVLCWYLALTSSNLLSLTNYFSTRFFNPIIYYPFKFHHHKIILSSFICCKSKHIWIVIRRMIYFSL